MSSPRCPVCQSLLTPDGWCPRCALDDALRPAEAVVGSFSIAGHLVLGELGRGGAGIVYRAQQQTPAREVALKILLPHEAASENSRARFRLEASTVATLDHPAILPVLSVGEHDGLPYFTMKLCAGGSLAERIARYRGAWRDIGTLLATLADAVHHAHVRGVLHRDLKPGNVLFDEADRPFVSDFGIAKSLVNTNQGSAPLTRPLVVMGTRGYLAPEILNAGVSAATSSADVYALGAILYELLTGAPPVAGTSPRPPATSSALQHDLFVIALKSLRADPAARYVSAGALADDLRAALAGRAIAARPMPPLAHAAAWARRNPALAALVAALVLTVTASAVILELKNQKLRSALNGSQASLAEALVAQATAIRQSTRTGHRLQPLELLRRAAAISVNNATRNEAVAALALPDWIGPETWRPWTGIAFFAVPSPSFDRVLTEDGKGNFSLRETASGREQWAWSAPAKEVSLPVFSPDGRWVAVRLIDDTVHVLDTRSGQPAFSLKGRPYAFKDSVSGYGRDMDFSPDSTRLAVTRPEGGVTFHRLPNGELTSDWAGPEWVTYVAFSPDGSRLAAGGSKNREQSAIVIVDVVSGQELARQKMSRRVDLVTWAPDGRLLALRSLAAMVEVRRATDLALTTSVPDRDALYGRFLGDGKRLLLAGQFGRTRLWDVARSRILLEAEEEGRPGSWFTANPVQLWRSFGAGPASIMTLSESPVLGMGDSEEDITSVSQFGGVGLATDARSLVVGGRGRSTLYDSISGRAIAHLHEGEGSESTTARIDETGSAIWLAMSASGLWRQPIHHPAAGEWSTSLAPERIDDERGFFCADLNAASHQLALVRPSDGTVKIVDVTTRTVVARWTHVGAANAVFSPDGTWLAVNSQLAGQPAATVHVTKDGATVRVLGADAGTHVAWSRDGRWIYAAESNGRGALWTTANWKRGPELLTGDKDQIRAGAFSPDGKILAVVDAFLGIRLIDVRSGQDLVALNAPETLGLVAGLGFLSQDRLCVVGSEGRIHTWDLTALQSELGKLGLGWNESH